MTGGVWGESETSPKPKGFPTVSPPSNCHMSMYSFITRHPDLVRGLAACRAVGESRASGLRASLVCRCGGPLASRATMAMTPGHASAGAATNGADRWPHGEWPLTLVRHHAARHACADEYYYRGRGSGGSGGGGSGGHTGGQCRQITRGGGGGGRGERRGCWLRTPPREGSGSERRSRGWLGGEAVEGVGRERLPTGPCRPSLCMLVPLNTHPWRALLRPFPQLPIAWVLLFFLSCG